QGNTSQKTATGSDGRYRFNNVPYGTYIVRISSIGYQEITRDILVQDGGQLIVDFKMEPIATGLEQVVVVGYGTQKRRDVTGAVATISSEDLNQGPITNPLQQISGKAAGVHVNQVGGEPGSAPNVRIRGISSLIGGNDPLVVIDGIQGNMDLLNQLPPSEIESVDILKDASATAIYGSRGAPGVLIVTTKRNRVGTTTMEYNGVSSVDAIARKLDMLDPDQWWEQAQKFGVPASANHGARTDWYDILSKNGMTQNHTVSLGGNERNFNYRASLNLIAQDGVVLRSNFQNYIGRIQATQKALDDKLSIAFNLNGSVRNTEGSPNGVYRPAFTSNLITNAYLM